MLQIRRIARPIRVFFSANFAIEIQKIMQYQMNFLFVSRANQAFAYEHITSDRHLECMFNPQKVMITTFSALNGVGSGIINHFNFIKCTNFAGVVSTII